MPYISSTIGPSPFLTTSNHHFHSNGYSSNWPHYSTNSSTNLPAYLAGYATPAQVYQEKYFPKDMIDVLPGVTNLQSEENEKIIHPLNTYSGNVFSNHRINSPFNRGEIYLPNKSTMTSSYSDVSSSNLLDNRGKESYLNKMENPFNKKYLLSEKNVQLQNYAQYYQEQRYEFTESIKNRSKRNQKNVHKFSTQKDATFSNDQIVNEVLEVKSKPKININSREEYRTQNYSKNQSRSDRHLSDSNPFKSHVLGPNYQEEYLIESQVDQKQFDSFGKGKQSKYQSNAPMEISAYKSYEKNKEQIKGKNSPPLQSIIVGLSKMTTNQHQKSINKPKSKKQLVFIDSDDDQRRSGTFVVPNAIIDQINKTRIASNIVKVNQNQSIYAYEKQFQRQKAKYTKEESIQVGKNPPNIITMRGKTFEKISL